MKKHIEVVLYNSDWPRIFEEESKKIKQALKDNCIAIYHVGSTSVPDLVAKPIIDIVVVAKDPQKSILPLKQIDFTYKGEYNIPMRFYFNNPYFNLHLYEEGHPEIELNLLFRDYLRKHTESKNEYAMLKAELLKNPASFEKNNSIFTGYNLGKNKFICKVLKQAGFNGVRFTKCTHHNEWDAAKHFRQKYFFDEFSTSDPYTWTFNHIDHIHLVLYQGVEIIGYTHIQLWPDKRAALRIIVINKTTPRKQRIWHKQFLTFIEKWLKAQGYKSIHTHCSPQALSFYKKHGFIDMSFNDPDGYERKHCDILLGKYLL